ncbi:hypothetical protein GQ607_006234 [Colletotrichum asianum]|uniref:Uncharacterized protein n=1 Tax=Colletotrichum asianum TaxID=702518 RepID=A0A8H3WIY9_9PEZI|nr:hypothetical protein GQ607_006234 [Colletotrichum asianum]
MPVGCPSWHPLPATTNLARPEDRYRTQSIIHPPVTRFCAFTALHLLAHACSLSRRDWRYSVNGLAKQSTVCDRCTNIHSTEPGYTKTGRH